MDLAVAHIQAAAMNEQLQSWLQGDLPDNDQDSGLPPAQRNGPRCRNIFIRRTSGWTRWECIEKEFTRMTGIPAQLVTWEVANDVDDGWPSAYLEEGKAGTFGGKETVPAGPRLPIDSIYMIAWVEGEGFLSPLRVYALAGSFEVSYCGDEVLSPSDLLEMVNADLFHQRWKAAAEAAAPFGTWSSAGDGVRCAGCRTPIIKRHGTWVDDTDGDGCCRADSGEEGVHAP